MQTLLNVTVFLLIAIILAACGGQREKSINGEAGAATKQNSQLVSLSVEGEVTREIYISTGETVSPIAYHVSVKIKNVGGSAIKYDQIVVGFFPKHGRALTQLTVPYDEMRPLRTEN